LEKNIEISIVTVGMNHLSYLQSFLKSLFVDYPPKVSFEVIYVDNCSTDDSVSFVSKHYPAVKIIENKSVLGFGDNNNKGVLLASGRYVAIMNPDLIFLENSLEPLYHYSERLGYDAVIAPKLLNLDRSFQYSVRGFITPMVFLARFLTLGNDETNNKIVQSYLCKDIKLDRPQFIDWAIGAALFFKRELYVKLGGFDKDYFLYVEDTDICLRAWKKGSAVIYYPQAEIIHNHLRASKKIGKKMFLHFKSLFIFFRKNGIFLKSFKNNSNFFLPNNDF